LLIGGSAAHSSLLIAKFSLAASPPFAFFGFVRGSLLPTSFNHQHLSPLPSGLQQKRRGFRRAHCSLLIANYSLKAGSAALFCLMFYLPS
jgi:hypothetical protein